MAGGMDSMEEEIERLIQHQEMIREWGDAVKELLAKFDDLSLTPYLYNSILDDMLSNYAKTVRILWDYLDRDCITQVLQNNHFEPRDANKLMLDCLIQKYRADVLEFCNILEFIPCETYVLSSVVITLRALREDLFFAIRNKFSEIVGMVGVHVVITVGVSVDNFNTLEKEYFKKFLLPPSYGSVCFTEEQGQKLKVAKVTTTLESCEVKNEMISKLEAKQPFVFYLNGLYSSISENPCEALDIVFNELNYPHYLLVVGNNSCIEEEIQTDIKIVASLAGLNDHMFSKLCESLQQNSYTFSNYHDYDNDNEAVFTLLIYPKIDQFIKILQKKLSLCYGHTLTVIYSGHADSDGSWRFSDDMFSTIHLQMIIQDAKAYIQHNLKIKILLNSCYGLKFAEQKLGYTGMFQWPGMPCGTPYLDTPRSTHDFLAELAMDQDDDDNGNYAVDTIKNYACSKWIDCTERSIKINNFITKQIVSKTDHVITMEENPNVSILPYTIGPLSAQEIIYNALEMQYAQLDTLDIFKITKDHLLPRHPATASNNLTPTDPQLIVFRAGSGDSTLFRWHNFNMLIDGGVDYARQPCFWNTVRQLPENQKLDLVVVTCSDADHCNGILRIFEEGTLPIEVGKLYTTLPPSELYTPHIVAKLYRKAEDHKRNGKLESVENLVTCPTRDLVENKHFNNGDILQIYMLTPTQENLDKAALLLPSTRSPHNIVSASLLIKCFKSSTGKYKYALLTGDACGENIYERLKEANNTIQVPREYDYFYCFDYIDMPHHGSACNKQKSNFLNKLKTSRYVISTNNPDDLILPYVITNNPDDYILLTVLGNNTVTDVHLTYPLRQNILIPQLQQKLSHTTDDNRCLIFTLGNQCFFRESPTDDVMN